MMKKLNSKKKKGFTLIELIIVVAILGILASIAIPKFGDAQKDAKITADIANAKTIADTTTMLITKGTISLTSGTQYFDLTDTNISGGLQSVPTPKAITGIFSVAIDNAGNVKVYAVAAKVDSTTALVANQVYPAVATGTSGNSWY